MQHEGSPQFTRRQMVQLGAAAPLLSGCGGGSSSNNPTSPNPSDPAAQFAIAQTSGDTFAIAKSTSSSIDVISFRRTAATLARPTALTSTSSLSINELNFDSEGRPSLAVDSSSGDITIFRYPTDESMAVFTYRSDGAFKSGIIAWKDASRFWAGTVPSDQLNSSSDVASPVEITTEVQDVLSQLDRVTVSGNSFLQRLFFVLPFGSAYAQGLSSRDLLGQALAFAAFVVASTWPALAVGAALLKVGPGAAAIGAIITFVATLLYSGSASAADEALAKSLIEDFVSRPFFGSLQLAGTISVPDDNGGQLCTGPFGIDGSVRLVLLPGNEATFGVSATEYMRTSCYSQKHNIPNWILPLQRSGNSLRGSVYAPGGNGWEINISIDSGLSTASGTVAYSYPLNGFSGSATQTVTLTR